MRIAFVSKTTFVIFFTKEKYPVIIQSYSTSYALINITEGIRTALDDWNIGCGVFVDLQKAFDTADHQILLDNRITMGFVEFQMIGLNLICLIAISTYA